MLNTFGAIKILQFSCRTSNTMASTNKSSHSKADSDMRKIIGHKHSLHVCLYLYIYICVCVCVCVCVCLSVYVSVCMCVHLFVSNSLQPQELQLPCFSVYGTFQARILEQVAISFSRGSSWPKDQTCASCVYYIGRQVLYQLSHQGRPGCICVCVYTEYNIM